MRAIPRVLCLMFVIAGCRRTAPHVETVKTGLPQVYTVNYPLAYFAGRIGAGLVDVVFPAPAREDPAFWQPAAEVVHDVQRADLILLNGADYAKWLKTATLPQSRMVDTSRAFSGEYLRHETAVTHSHGPGGAHEHGVLDFTTWLDPDQARKQAAAVADALVTVCPENAVDIRERFRLLDADLAGLDRMLTETAKALGGRVMVASHPVYAYMARRYGLSLVSMHWEPDEMPDQGEWTQLSALVKDRSIRIMLWEDEPATAIADRLKRMGLLMVVFRPCGNRPPQGDYVTEMEQNIRRLGAVL